MALRLTILGVELRHLQYFIAVATTGGFGRAARSLHVSQSAISEQVRDLEEEIGAELFDRTQRQIRLTAEGEIFLDGAKETLAAAERAVKAVHRSKRGEEGRLTIGFFVGGNGRFFPELIRAFRAQYPLVKVSLVEMVPAQQWAALQAGTIDVGFTRPNTVMAQGTVRTEKFYSERLYAVLPKDHPLALQTEIYPKELREENFVMCERQTSPAVFDRIFALCAEAGFVPKIVTTASVSSGVIALTEAGEGVSVVPDGSRIFGSPEVAFVPLAGPGTTVEMVLAWTVAKASGVQKAFLQLARKFRADTSA